MSDDYDWDVVEAGDRIRYSDNNHDIEGEVTKHDREEKLVTVEELDTMAKYTIGYDNYELELLGWNDD